jgi:hypothetical protein
VQIVDGQHQGPRLREIRDGPVQPVACGDDCIAGLEIGVTRRRGAKDGRGQTSSAGHGSIAGRPVE